MKFAINAPVLIQVVTLRCAKTTLINIPQGEVSATAKAIVKEIAFNRWTNYARAKDVTEFNAAKKADVIFRRDFRVSPNPISIRIYCRENVLSPPRF